MRDSAKVARARLREIKRSRRIPGDERLLAFLRWVRDEEVLACKLIRAELNKGAGLEVLAGTGGENGYTLEVEPQPDGMYEITFGCLGGPDAGDGGIWRVKFDAAGRVAEGTKEGFWVC